jgi:hypothetical protein
MISWQNLNDAIVFVGQVSLNRESTIDIRVAHAIKAEGCLLHCYHLVPSFSADDSKKQQTRKRVFILVKRFLFS